MDASWMVELDKFINNQPNKLKEHKKYYASEYEFIDKSFPTVEQADALF